MASSILMPCGIHKRNSNTRWIWGSTFLLPLAPLNIFGSLQGIFCWHSPACMRTRIYALHGRRFVGGLYLHNMLPYFEPLLRYAE